MAVKDGHLTRRQQKFDFLEDAENTMDSYKIQQGSRGIRKRENNNISQEKAI
jgi:hypothetical protein